MTQLTNMRNAIAEEMNSRIAEAEMETIRYDNKTLTLDYPAQLDNYHGGVAWYASAHGADGNRYEIRWDYIEPEWAESLTPEEKNAITDLSDFANWENPAEVKEV